MLPTSHLWKSSRHCLSSCCCFAEHVNFIQHHLRVRQFFLAQRRSCCAPFPCNTIGTAEAIPENLFLPARSKSSYIGPSTGTKRGFQSRLRWGRRVTAH